MDNYKIRAVLQGHSADVKQVAASLTSDGSLVSASRDKTARLWQPMDDNTYTLRKTFRGSLKYVSCVTSAEPSEEYPSGLVLTGSQDGMIRGYLPDVEEPLFQLEGHKENVTSLYLSKFGTLISASWDKTAKVWFNKKCTMTLSGHDLAVWCAGILPGVGVMVTGSADRTLRLWRTGKCEQILKGHTDAVRGIAIVSAEQFLSCSNDATVRRWNGTGECLGTYYGHENFIYSINLLPNGKDWVTSGEDRTVRVWKDNEVCQTIYHPAISVWTVCCLPNGDIASGASDGIIRIFSADPSRHASAEIQGIFEAELSKLALAAQQELGGVKLSDLPGPEALFEPGSKDGQTKMVRDGELVSVHSWSMGDQKWTKIGDVVGAAGGSEKTSGKKLHQGKEYDYVFDIEIDEPKSTLKLPFNVTDDPYMAAQQFIHKHELSQYYLEEIATHIMKNTEGKSLGALQNVDPLTGGASYSTENSGSSSLPASGGMAVDPFTGSGAYTSGSGGVETGMGNGPAVPDPWMQGAYRSDEGTGGGAVVDMDVQETNPYFPQSEFLRFDQGIKGEAMLKKMKELNSLVPEEKQLTESQLENLPKIAIEEADNKEGVASMLKILSWDHAHIFPCLDLIRLVILHPINQNHIIEKTFLDTLFSVCLSSLSKQSPMANQFLSLRVLSNLFSVQEGAEFMLLYRDSVISRLLTEIVDIENKNVQIAAATLFLNYAAAFAQQPAATEEGQVQVLSGLGINCISFITDWEARFRILVAIGTIITLAKDNIEYANTLEMKDGVRGWKVLEGPEKCTACAQAIINLL